MNIKEMWEEYVAEKDILNNSEVLFEANAQLEVSTIKVGANTVLERTNDIDRLIMESSRSVMEDFQKGSQETEGVIYMMYREGDQGMIPLYVGIAEKVGKSGRLSTLFNGKTKKPRWDYYDGYHIGDLSTVVCEGYETAEKGKVNWAKSLFEDFPSKAPVLNFEVKLWFHVWRSDSLSIFSDLGHSSLLLEESLIIEILGRLYPDSLLNIQGKLRQINKSKEV